MLSRWFIYFILVPIPLLGGGHLSKELAETLSQHGQAHGVECPVIHYFPSPPTPRKSEHREVEAVGSWGGAPLIYSRTYRRSDSTGP